jgi:phosphoglycerate dehydrogenase-like enzyme
MVDENIVELGHVKREWFVKSEKKLGEHIAIIPKKEFIEAIHESTTILIGKSPDFTIDLLQKCPNLKMIYVLSAGVNGLPFKYLLERGIVVGRVAGIHEENISNYVIGSILYFSTKLIDCVNAQQKRKWIDNLKQDNLRNKEALIIGAGRIGNKIAEKLKWFNINSIAITQSGKSSNRDLYKGVYTIKSLSKLLPEVDYVILSLPLTEKTKNIINKDTLSKMRRSAILVNVSRGELIEEEALVCALENHELGGAVLDVFCQEPLPYNSPLWALDNCIISPHCSGRTTEYLSDAMDKCIDSIIAFRKDAYLPIQVDLKKEY